MLISLFEQLPGCWGCKDTQSRFVHVNHAYVRLIGARTPDELIGKSDDQLPGAIAEHAKAFFFALPEDTHTAGGTREK